MDLRPGYKQTEVGVIPQDWEVKQIAEFEPFVTSGSRGWARFYSDRGSPFLRITNLSRTCIYPDLHDLRFVTLAAHDSEAVVKQIADSSAGTTVGTYTISNAKKTVIPYPTMPEQEAIATVLSDIDADIAVLDAKLVKARQLKEGMMQELVTGRIRLV